MGDFSNVDGDASVAGNRYRSGGEVTGVDAQIAPRAFVGVSFSYPCGSLDLDGRSDSTDVDSPQIALYGSAASDQFILKGVANVEPVRDRSPRPRRKRCRRRTRRLK